jgi:hypothetical protein
MQATVPVIFRSGDAEIILVTIAAWQTDWLLSPLVNRVLASGR